ncbi:MAG: RNA polymerase sigma factor [Terriglobia bacterium]
MSWARYTEGPETARFSPGFAHTSQTKILCDRNPRRRDFVYTGVDAEEITGSPLMPYTDLAAAARGLEGISAEEFDGIVLANQQRVFRVLFSLVRDRDAADTLTQECFLRAYRKRQTFRGESSVTTWLIRIAMNLARDHARNRRLAFWRTLFAGHADERAGQPPTEISDPAPSPERAFLAREQLNAVWAAIEQLPRQQRTVFSMRFAGEMSLREIADVMDLEIATVKAHLFRAVAAVKKQVGRGEAR